MNRVRHETSKNTRGKADPLASSAFFSDTSNGEANRKLLSSYRHGETTWEDLHAKRVLSLTYAVLGVVHAANLGVHLKKGPGVGETHEKQA